jgi:hypothetical protein
MNTRTNKTILLITLMICLATAVYSAVGTFTFRTSGASDTTEVVDLRYPQKVPEDSSVTTDSIADGSITNDKLAEPVSVANGGTGKTTAAEALAALGGASLNGSSTVAFNASTINGLPALTTTSTHIFVSLSAHTPLPNNVATTLATFTEIIDAGEEFTVGAATSTFTPTSAGIYLFTFYVNFSGPSTGNRFAYIIRVSDNKILGVTHSSASGETEDHCTISRQIRLAAGESVRFAAKQSSGFALQANAAPTSAFYQQYTNIEIVRLR